MVGILLFAGVVLAYLVIDGVIGAGEIVKKGVLPFHTLSLRTFVSYLQVASMIVLYDMRIPDAVSALVTVETFASSAGDALVGIDCLSTMAPFELFMAKQVIIAVMPLVLSIILAAIYGIRVVAEPSVLQAAMKCLHAAGEVYVIALAPKPGLGAGAPGHTLLLNSASTSSTRAQPMDRRWRRS